MSSFIYCFMVIFLFYYFFPHKNQSKFISSNEFEVLDGDTVKILAKGGEQFIRLKGIDAPEKKQLSFSGEAIGSMATEALEKMLIGKTLWIQSFGEDVYGRTLGTLYSNSANGKDHNLALVRKGLVLLYPYTKFETLEQKRRYILTYKRARREEKGLWGLDGFSSPKWFRKKCFNSNKNCQR